MGVVTEVYDGSGYFNINYTSSISSVGQSIVLITQGSQVRALY